jgi:hypothetical protein
MIKFKVFKNDLLTNQNDMVKQLLFFVIIFTPNEKMAKLSIFCE